MSNPSDRSHQTAPLINSNSTDSVVAPVDTASTPGRVSQFVNNVNLSSLIQSNSFLHSDFGDFVEIPQNNPMPNNSNNNSQPRTSSSNSIGQNMNVNNHNHSHESSQTVLDLQGTVNDSQEATGGEPPDPTQDQASRASSIVSFLFSSLQSSFPFFLFIVAKIFHEHLMGFFIVLAFMTTLHWTNRSLVHQVELRDKKQNTRLALIILFLLLNTGIFFYIFKEQQLYKCLVFMAPNEVKMDTWNLIWIVVCTDTIIKYITICLKAIVTLLPFRIMPLRKRGAFYSLIETSTQFYRSLTPIHPWIIYLFYADQKDVTTSIDHPTIPSANLTDVSNQQPTEFSSLTLQNRESTFILIFLCILYTICKLNQLYNMGKELWASFRDMKGGLSSVRKSSPVSENEDNICPICQDKLASPVVLNCQHVFCEDCVCVWLDKENSCPMCRAKIAVKKPQYKDGSTTIFIQWY